MTSVRPWARASERCAPPKAGSRSSSPQIADITAANVRSVEAGKYAVNIDVLNKIAMALGAELRMIEKE